MSRTFNLADLFEVVAGVVPQRLAFICGDHRLTYQQLDDRATRLASALRNRGVQRGSNVGIQLHNSAEYLEAFLACCKIGAAPVNINYRYVADELHQLFTSLDLQALVFGAEFGEAVHAVAPAVPTLKLLLCVGPPAAVRSTDLIYDEVLASGSGQLADPDRSDDDIYMLCTGGTTGRPKGVMWPHKSLLMAALGGGGIYFGRPPIERPEDLAELVPQGPPMVYFAAAPMMHGAAMWASLISLLAGHAVLVNDQPTFDAEHIWDLIEHHRVNIVSIVGDAMAQPLVRALEAQPHRWDLSHLRIFGNGGAVFSRHLQDRLKAQVPHLVLNNGLGSSESGLVGGGHKPVAAGDGMIVVPSRPDLAVIGDEGGFLTAAGSEGVLARSGYTPIGYYGDPVKSAQTFVRLDGRVWVLTGDRARIDDDGSYIVLGRGSQCINTGGEKVFPEEVEEAARRAPGVDDVLVVGLPDERWGQRVTAIVQATPGVDFDPAAFELACRTHLSGYKVPKTVLLAPQIQRSPAGKADYAWARSFAEQHAGQAPVRS